MRGHLLHTPTSPGALKVYLSPNFCEFGVVILQAGSPWLWPLPQVVRGMQDGTCWVWLWSQPTCLVDHLLPIPACHPGLAAGACLLCYSAEQLVLGRCCFIGGAVKLFIGEVGAGNEAKSQPRPRRKKRL